MKIRNVLRIAFVAIRRNAVRSALTMLGVIIGVASVIAMISLVRIGGISSLEGFRSGCLARSVA